MDVVLRATAMFAIVFVLLRLLGKRELAQMTPFELLVLIVIGDLIQQGITHNDFSLTGATLAIATFGFWSAVLAWGSHRWPKVEQILDGEPAVLIERGKLVKSNMDRHRITRAEIEGEMRLAGIAHIEQVEWAVLETEGKISFIRTESSHNLDPAEEKPATT